MTGSKESSEQLADLSIQRATVDSQRYKANMHNVNTRMEPTVSARGVSITSSVASAASSLTDSFSAEPTASSSPEPTTPSMGKAPTPAAGDIDVQATLAAIADAFETVKNVASPKELSDLKKAIKPASDDKREKRMKMALAFLLIMGAVVFLSQRQPAKAERVRD